MSGRKVHEMPTPLARGRDRFEAWRRRRELGTRIPERLWKLAVKLASAHGLKRTASVLKLDYGSPQQLRKAAATEARRSLDVEHAASLLGHSSSVVTQDHYAAADRQRRIDPVKTLERAVKQHDSKKNK